MILILHVISALTSIAFTIYLLLRPQSTKMHIHYGLAGITTVSGIYLIVTTKTHMIESCLMGVAYLAAVSLGTIAIRTRLSRTQPSPISK